MEYIRKTGAEQVDTTNPTEYTAEADRYLTKFSGGAAASGVESSVGRQICMEDVQDEHERGMERLQPRTLGI